jgi:hypothetical protein
VEFLISPSEQANLAVVSMRPVNPAFLTKSGPAEASARRQVTVLKPRYAAPSEPQTAFSGPADFSEAPQAKPHGGPVVLAASGNPISVGDDTTGSPVANSPVVKGTAAIADSGSPVTSVSARFAPAQP